MRDWNCADAGAGFTIATQAHFAPNCDQMNSHAAIFFPNSQSLTHGCGTHTVGQPQQEWLNLDKQPDTRQLHSQVISVASASTTVSDRSLQLQVPTRYISHSRQLQAIPYPAGAGRGVCVPHEELSCCHSIAVHITMHGGVCAQQDQLHNGHLPPGRHDTPGIVLLTSLNRKAFCCRQHVHISFSKLSEDCEAHSALLPVLLSR
jgi:hypothetical protein